MANNIDYFLYFYTHMMESYLKSFINFNERKGMLAFFELKHVYPIRSIYLWWNKRQCNLIMN